MGYKLFLDTNIIIDFVQERTFGLDAIKEILHFGELGKLQLFISETVITTGFYVLQKEKIEALPVFRELCKTINIVPFSKEIIYFPVDKFKDIEDGLLYFLALHGKMNYFITRNVKDFSFQFPSLPVISPTHFIKEIYLNDIS